jgi:HAD superfamily hydrolase (TIGR01509 family)
LVKRVFLLDFDGTVVDSIPILYRMYCQFLKKFGVEGTPEEFEELNGTPIGEAAETLGRRHGLKVGLGGLVKEYGERMIRAYCEQVACMPGIEAFLKRASELGVTVAMVTSASRRLVEKCLEAKGLKTYFSAIFTASGLKKGKPDPEIYNRALIKLGIDPSDAVAIEDSVNGVASARGAGISTLLFAPQGEAIEGVVRVHSWEEALRCCFV